MRSVHLGPADRVTLVRAVLTAVVAGLVLTELADVAPGWWRGAVVAVGASALVLDGVDGWVARRTGTASEGGARFDMETDAALVLVLSVPVAVEVGAWALLIGLARYLLLLAQALVPRLRDPLRPRSWRKVVAVVQGVALLVAVSGAVPRAATVALVGTALGLLALSFGTEAVERYSARTPSGDRLQRRTRGLTVLAAVVGWAALVAPAALVASGGTVTWSWPAVRLPAEALLVVGAGLLLPRRAGRIVAGGLGAAVGVLVVLTALDVGFPVVLDRPFDVLGDWTYLGSAVGVVADTHGSAAAALVVVAAVAATLALVTAPAWAFDRVATRSRGNRSAATSLAATVAALSLVSAGWAAPTAAPGLVSAPSATALADEITAVRTALDDPEVFGRDLADDAWAGVPGDRLLTALRGHDVLLVVVESYGRVAVDDPRLSTVVGRALEDGDADLAAAGYSARSAFLTSPTFGGGSWLAHSTLQSGTWVDSQRRYDRLLASDRLTLSRAFSRAGWRSVIAAPAVTRDWPEARTFYGVDALVDSRTSGYRGLAFGYAPAPDQYTLAHLARTELGGSPDRRRVMAEVDLVSSHHPWTPVPRLLPWDEVGDGSAFAAPTARDAVDATSSTAATQRAYALSVASSLRAVTTFPATVPDDDLVLLVVGDHQPHHRVSGPDPGHDVPVSLVARDPDVLRAAEAWGWGPGLRPAADAPVERMDTVRDLLLSSFSSGPGTAR